MSKPIGFPFLPVDLHAPNHPKILRFKRRHGPGSWHDLLGLWLWVAMYRPDGDLSGMDNEEIEAAAEWRGVPGGMVASMVECGFLDGEVQKYRVHNWRTRQRHFVEMYRRWQTARRMRHLRQSRSVTRDADVRDRDAEVTPRVDKKRVDQSREEKIDLARPSDSLARGNGDRPTRKPLSEQDGLIGIHASDWKSAFGGVEPTWDKGTIIQYHQKRAKNPHLPDDHYIAAFRLGFIQDPYWRDRQAPFASYVRHLDRFLASVERSEEGFTVKDKAIWIPPEERA
jgi:hypothetical protein